jgi:hypothetical protein
MATLSTDMVYHLHIRLADKEMRAWAGKHFDPELFSLQAVNSALALLQ